MKKINKTARFNQSQRSGNSAPKTACSQAASAPAQRHTRINQRTSNRTSRPDPERIHKNKTVAA